MLTQPTFDYDRAFSRNRGLLDSSQQQCLKNARVAVAGLGGVGGSHVQALARLGIGAFHLADLDTFSLENMNRQLGATMNNLGREKALVLAESVQDINPQANVKVFRKGIRADNLDTFLQRVDVMVDGLDFFAMDERRMLYAACRTHGIPVVNAGPIGFGASLVTFLPDGMSFETFFNLDDIMTPVERLMAFGLTLNPRVHRDMRTATVDVERQTGPAVASSCFLCSAAAAQETLKLLTGMGVLNAAPHGIYFDLQHNAVRRIRRKPHLRKTWRGRVIRAIAMRRMPAVRKIWEEQMREWKIG